jgi:hypothetical protein
MSEQDDGARMTQADLDAVIARSREADVTIVPAALMRRMVTEIQALWAQRDAARAEGERIGREQVLGELIDYLRNELLPLVERLQRTQQQPTPAGGEE